MNLRIRKLLMATLLVSFGGQTAMVYLDDTSENRPGLSPLAVQGRRLWHRHNCQVCHQIYGFGGFLGPDLTNAASRLSRTRLDEVLTLGTAQMPRFHFDSGQIDAIETFLRELDETGVGVARRSAQLDSSVVFAVVAAHAAEQPAPAPARRGMDTFRNLCAGCHVPFQSTPLGLNTAPDLSTVVDRLADDAIRVTIVQGRLPKGMPAWATLAGSTVDDVVAFFHWLRSERDPIAASLPPVDTLHGLPWWEFK